jgi:hypothetical protein
LSISVIAKPYSKCLEECGHLTGLKYLIKDQKEGNTKEKQGENGKSE